MARSINTREQSFTDRSEMVKRLLAELSDKKHEPMTTDEEIEAFANIEANREKIINANMRFVFAVAKRYGKEDEVCDYFSSGCIGLSEAIDKFDVTKGFKFISFAVHYIRMAMSAQTLKSGLVQSSNKAKLGSKVRKYEERFFAENGYYPSDDEILKYLKEKFNFDSRFVTEIHGASFTSLDKKFDADSDDTISEIGDIAMKSSSRNLIEDKIEEENTKHSANILLNSTAISEIERNVLRLIFIKGWTREKVGVKFGITAERVRQIQCKALSKLKAYAERHQITA